MEVNDLCRKNIEKAYIKIRPTRIAKLGKL